MKQAMLILSVQSYQIRDEKTNEVTAQGISVQYIPADNLEPTEDLTAADRGTLSKGSKVAKVSLPYSMYEKLSRLPFPAMYDASLKMNVVSGKMQLQITDIDLIGPVHALVDETYPSDKQTA